MSVNPVTTEIIRNALISTAEEMNGTLIRSAFTPIIYEMKDCAVAVLDEHHRVMGQSSGLAIFLGNLEVCSRATEERFGRNVWQPGDVWIMNDTYIAGTHLNDVTVYSPIFHQGELFAFSSSRAHWLEIGAKDPSSPFDSTSIFQEGLRLGPTRIVIGGELNRDVVDIITANTRLPKAVMGDMRAQIAAAHVGQKRIEALIEKFGLDIVRAAREEIYNQTERLERQAVACIPDGQYEATGLVDDDGLGNGPLHVTMKVAVKGDCLSVDMTDCSDAAKGPINSGEAQTISACRVGFKYLFASHVPVNGGSFRCLSVKTRPGSFLACQEPAPAAWYFSSLGLQIDLLARALAPAAPEIVHAADYGDSNPLIFAGTDPRTGKPFIDLECHVGGWGAWQGTDGESGLINKVNAGLKDIPIEICESRYPLRVRHYGFRPDSGGPGKWRGGCGIIREYEVLGDDVTIGLWWERSKTPAWGLFGGSDGTPPDVTINPGRNSERKLLKCNALPLARGDIVHCESGGGGGYGPACERDWDAVRYDVAEGYVSDEQAQRIYGLRG